MKWSDIAVLGAGLLACSPRPTPGAPPAAPSPAPPAAAASPAPSATVDVPAVVAEPEAEPAPDVGPISADSGWATFHADSGRTGSSQAQAIRRPRIRWKSKVGVQSWLNGPLALGSIAVVPSSGTRHNTPDPQDGVHALDMKTGRRVWHARMSGDANGALATAGRVIATSDDGHVYAFDVERGKELWKQKGEGKMYSHPLRFGDRVIVGDATGFVRAYSVADGKPLWSTQLTGAIRGGASADDQHVYVVSQGGEAASLRADGKPAWRVQLERPDFGGTKNVPIEAYSTPVVTGDLVIVPFARDTYYQDVPAVIALDKRSGRVRWRAKGPGQWGNVRSTPAVVQGLIVWGEPYSGDVAALSTATGRLVYRRTIGACYFPQWSSPAAAGEVVYLPRFDGSLYALSAKNGQKIWDLYLGDQKQAGKPSAPPASSGCDWDVPSGHSLYAPAAVAEDGTLLVGSGEGILYAIEQA